MRLANQLVQQLYANDLFSQMKQQHRAGVIDGNKIIISDAQNKYNDLISCHAEIDAIMKYLRNLKKFMPLNNSFNFENGIIKNKRKNQKIIQDIRRRGIKVCVIRLSKENNLINSKPCQFCIEYMKYFGVRKIYYTDENGQLIKESMNSISDNRNKSKYEKIKTRQYFE